MRQGREVDEFDTYLPTYILGVTADRQVVGCVLLLPATGPTMMTELLRPIRRWSRVPESAWITRWRRRGREVATRRHVHHVCGDHRMVDGTGFTEIVTGAAVRFERILKGAGWPMTRERSATK